MTRTNVDPLTDWKGFFKEIQNESPRAAVIIASAFLDAQLRNLLSKYFVGDPDVVDELLGTEKKPDRPLSSFSSRIKAAYCLGLISKNTYQDLNTVRKIRNKFAHKLHGYTFDKPEIISWCKSLNFAKIITDAIPKFPNTHQNMFLLGVTQLASWIALNTLKIDRLQRPAAKDPELVEVVD